MKRSTGTLSAACNLVSVFDTRTQSGIKAEYMCNECQIKIFFFVITHEYIL